MDFSGKLITLGGAVVKWRDDLMVVEVGGAFRVVDADGFTPSGAIRFVMQEESQEDTERRRLRTALTMGRRAAKGKKGRRQARGAFRSAVGQSLAKHEDKAVFAKLEAEALAVEQASYEFGNTFHRGPIVVTRAHNQLIPQLLAEGWTWERLLAAKAVNSPDQPTWEIEQTKMLAHWEALVRKEGAGQ